MAKKYQVFISSTYEDLKTQRDEVVKTILRIGHLPVGMEMFNAGNDTQWEIIKRYIDNSDYYVVILAHRYGSEAPDGMGYTEKEYEYAQAQGVPCLGFIIHDDADWSPKLMAKGEQAAKLDAFKSKIKNRMVSFWRSTDNLALLVSNALAETFITHPRTGWVRATEATSPQVADELARLSKENKELQTQLLQFQRKTQAETLDEIMSRTPVASELKHTAHLNLKDVFIQACDLLPDSTAFGVANKMEHARELDYDEWDPLLGIIEKAFSELQRLGVLTQTDVVFKTRIEPDGVSRNNYQTRLWALTEKGTQLYTLIKYSS